MKKLYIVPETLVSHAASSYVLSASLLSREEKEEQEWQNSAARFNFLCPHIKADTRCRKYNRFIRAGEGILVEPSDTPEYMRISTRSTQACPYRDTCDRLKRYMELTNGKQH